MTDIVLVPVTGGSNLSAINSNFDKIEDAVNNDILHLEGGNNTMKQDLDLNGHQLLNHQTDLNDPDSLINVGDADSRYYNVSGDTLAGNMNAAGNKILNLPAATAPHEPMRKNEVDATNAAQDAITADNNSKAVRTNDAISAMSENAAARKDKLLSFDNSGNPVAIAAANQSATDLELRLADYTDLSHGATLVGNATRQASDIAELRTIVGRYNEDRINLLSYSGTPSVGAGTFLWNSTSTAPDNAGSVIQVTGVVTGRWELIHSGKVNVFQFGAKGDGTTSDSKAFQTALSFMDSVGGGDVFVPVPSVNFFLDYPIFLFDNVNLYGEGPGSKIKFIDPVFAHGRGGIVVGSSLEANRDKALAAYAANTFPGASTIDNTYINLPLGTFLRDNQSSIECRDATVHDLYIIAEFTAPDGWGGYGVNFVNAWNCHAWNIWGEGWTQLIGMGSDVAPETPSNHMCTAKRLYVVEPSQVRTYYAIGFMANSTNCTFEEVEQYSPCVGTMEGNGVAANTCEDSVIKNVHIPDLGHIGSSAGVYLADCKDFLAEDIYVGNAIRAVQTFFFVSSGDAARPVVIRNVTGVSCDMVVSLGTKFARVFGITNVNSTTDLNLFNSNTTGCVVRADVRTITFGAGFVLFQYLDNNSIQGWEQKSLYLRPAQLLLNDKVDANSWNANKTVASKAATRLQFEWPIQMGIRAVRDLSVFGTFAGDTAAAGTTLTLQLRRQVVFTGNTGEAPIIEQTAQRTGQASSFDFQLSTTVTEAVINDPPSSGLANSLDVYLDLQNPTLNCVVKELRVRFYG